MSLTTCITDDMECICPSCSEYIEIEDDDLVDILDDGNPEYLIFCPYCGQSFYASKSYI